MTTRQTRYQVVVDKGECALHGDGTRSPIYALRCGHLHRTEEAAERCRQALIGEREEGRRGSGRWVCSAKWYTAHVVPCGPRGEDACGLCHTVIPPGAGHCPECAKRCRACYAPDNTHGGICAACARECGYEG